jgi:hypothetical protein
MKGMRRLAKRLASGTPAKSRLGRPTYPSVDRVDWPLAGHKRDDFLSAIREKPLGHHWPVTGQWAANEARSMQMMCAYVEQNKRTAMNTDRVD